MFNLRRSHCTKFRKTVCSMATFWAYVGDQDHQVDQAPGPPHVYSFSLHDPGLGYNLMANDLYDSAIYIRSLKCSDFTLGTSSSKCMECQCRQTWSVNVEHWAVIFLPAVFRFSAHSLSGPFNQTKTYWLESSFNPSFTSTTLDCFLHLVLTCLAVVTGQNVRSR